MHTLVTELEEGTLSGELTLAAFARAQSLALTRFAYLLCGDHQRAEDLVQEAYLALYRHFGETLPLAAPVAYARRVIVNAQVARARKRSSTETPTAELPERAVADGDSAEQDAMWGLLAALPARQRAVLVLRYYLDLPDPEIAAVLGCRAGTVRSLAARAFAALRAQPANPASGGERPRA